MSARTFLDTNVIVYAFDDADEDKRDRARAVLEAEGRSPLVISTQVLGEFYAVVTRKLAPPMSQAQAAEAVDEFARLPTIAADATLVKAGIAISRGAQVSYWDGLILAAAEAGGCDRLLSEDLSAGQAYGSVVVENPFA